MHYKFCSLKFVRFSHIRGDNCSLILEKGTDSNLGLFCKGHNSLNYCSIILQICVQMENKSIKFFCSLNCIECCIQIPLINYFLKKWRPSWIFGGHIGFFFGQHNFFRLHPRGYLYAKFVACIIK